MVDDKADDPVGVVREILAHGPVPAPEFRRLAHAKGIPVKLIPKAARAAGAEPRRTGPPGQGGWVWALGRPADDGTITRPGRSGLYAHFYAHGQEVQRKLTEDDDLAEARCRLAALREQLAAEAAARVPRPRPAGAPRQPRAELPLHAQLREVARHVLQLCRQAKALEAKGAAPERGGP